MKKFFPLFLALLLVLPAQAGSVTTERSETGVHEVDWGTTEFFVQFTGTLTDPDNDVEGIFNFHLVPRTDCSASLFGHWAATYAHFWSSGEPFTANIMEEAQNRKSYLQSQSKAGDNYWCFSVVEHWFINTDQRVAEAHIVLKIFDSTDGIGANDPPASSDPIVDLPEGDGTGFFETLPLSPAHLLPLIFIPVIRRKYTK